MPKGKFPFNSVNTQNLAPACNDCNSCCKKEDVPVRSKGTKRKAFFPFAAYKPDIKISIDVTFIHPTDSKQNQVAITCTSATYQEEVDTWIDLYNIDERYNDKCCRPEAIYWLQQVLDEGINYGVDPNKALTNQINSRKNNPLQECNFLRVPFLEGCHRANIL